MVKEVLFLDEDDIAREIHGVDGEKIEASQYELPQKSICNMYPKRTIEKYAVTSGFDEVSSECMDFALNEQKRQMVIGFANMIEDELKKEHNHDQT